MRVTVTDGPGKIRIDTLERYIKKNGGDLARKKQMKSNTFEFQFKYQKGNSINLNRDTVMGRVVTITSVQDYRGKKITSIIILKLFQIPVYRNPMIFVKIHTFWALFCALQHFLRQN